MVVLVVLEVGYYLLLISLAFILQGDLPSFIQIVGFVTVGELLKLYLEPKLAKNADVPNTTMVPMIKKKQTDGNVILKVQPFTVALDVDVQLPPAEKQNEYIKNKKSCPIVQSIHVYKMCVALGLDAELSDMKKRQPFVPKLQKQSAAKRPPTVKSLVVFKLCDALKLPAQLAEL
ncbi:hypothetical protein NPIL_370471 [Nephila pilipes]|uniref:Uncharacterized protein n=1 Tax=Nephila pilipes TaxID=299642 RepID=A0A8X6P4L7_NEPPI|nr:hypothetical protein NPIL_370471 [Nephila pilipes]